MMCHRHSFRSITRGTILVGLLAVTLQGVASAATYSELVPVTFTVQSDTPAFQVVCTNNKSSSWDTYSNNPTWSGTISANLVMSWDTTSGGAGTGNGTGDSTMQVTQVRLPLNTRGSRLRTTAATSRACVRSTCRIFTPRSRRGRVTFRNQQQSPVQRLRCHRVLCSTAESSRGMPLRERGSLAASPLTCPLLNNTTNSYITGCDSGWTDWVDQATSTSR